MKTILVPIGSWGGSGGSSTLDQELPHKRVGHPIFTQNLKTLGLWVLSLIKHSTSTFLWNVGLNSPHTCHNSSIVR
jgi:hypothetical protein